MYGKEVKIAIEIIERNLKISFPITEVLGQVNMEKSQFSKVFNFYSGYTMKEYQRKRVLSEAAIELKRGVRIIDVAFNYGYGSPEAFSRAFKKEFNAYPSECLKKKLDVEMTGRLSDEIIEEKSEFLNDNKFDNSIKFITEIKESLTNITDVGLFDGYSFDGTSHSVEVKINLEKSLEFFESLSDIVLHRVLFEGILKSDDKDKNGLRMMLSIKYLIKFWEYYEEIARENKLTITEKELENAFFIINNYYDVDNPVLCDSNYYFKLNKMTLKIIDDLKYGIAMQKVKKNT